MAEVVLTRRSVVKNEYELLADVTVSSATTQVDITGLNIGKDEEIVLVADVLHTTYGTIGLLFNGNYTQTNNWTQEIGANNTTVSSGRQNKSFFVYGTGNGSKTFCIIKIKLTNSGYVISQSSIERDYGGSSIVLGEAYTTTTFTVASITSIRILSENANQIGIGSRFQLYKVAK